MPRKIATLDFETDPFLYDRYPIPFMGGLFDGENFYLFEGEDCVEELLFFLFDKEWVVYAHNGGRFDYHFIAKYIPDFTDVQIIAGRVAKFTIGLCEFRDSINLLPISLDQYQKTAIDYAKFEKDVRHIHRNEIADYLKDDCVFLYEIITRFTNEYGRHLTQATAAMKFWQKQSNIKLEHSDAEYYDNFKSYYYGGRVQCFKKGIIKGEFLSADINSAYPFAMLSDHPFGFDFFTLTPSVSEVIETIESWQIGFFKITAVAYGCLPFRNEKNNSLEFPNDEKERLYYVTGHEVKAGLDTGTLEIKKVHELKIHCETVNFTEYVNHFYGLRLQAKKDGDQGLNIICKIFLNALYGKWASNPSKYRKYKTGPVKSLEWMKEELNYNFCGTLGTNLIFQKELEEEEQKYYNLATGASITGFVRAYLWRSIHASKNVLYCDTDCIVCENFDESARFGSALGEWEIEGYYNSVAIGGKKLYSMRYNDNPKNPKKSRYKKASKGSNLEPEQIYKVAEGETVEYLPMSPTYSAFNIPTFVKRKIKMT